MAVLLADSVLTVPAHLPMAPARRQRRGFRGLDRRCGAMQPLWLSDRRPCPADRPSMLQSPVTHESTSGCTRRVSAGSRLARDLDLVCCVGWSSNCRASSSSWQSSGLLIRGLWVRAPRGPPDRPTRLTGPTRLIPRWPCGYVHPGRPARGHRLWPHTRGTAVLRARQPRHRRQRRAARANDVRREPAEDRKPAMQPSRRLVVYPP